MFSPAKTAAVFGAGALSIAAGAFPALSTPAPYHTKCTVLPKAEASYLDVASDAIHVVVIGNTQKNKLGLGPAIMSAEGMNNPIAAVQISGNDASQIGFSSGFAAKGVFATPENTGIRPGVAMTLSPTQDFAKA